MNKLAKNLFCSLVLILSINLDSTAVAGITEQKILDPTSGNFYTVHIEDADSTDRLYTYPTPVLGGIIEDKNFIEDANGIISPNICVDRISVKDNAGTALSWEDACPVLAKTLAFSVALNGSLPNFEYQTFGLSGTHAVYRVPKAFSAYVFKTQIDEEEEREKLYMEFFLNLFAREDWEESDNFASSLPSSGQVNFTKAAITGTYILTRFENGLIQSLVNNGTDSARTILNKAGKRSGNVPDTFNFIGHAFDLLKDMSDETARQAMLLRAYNKQWQQTSARNIVNALENSSLSAVDPAMKNGAKMALQSWNKLAESRFKQFCAYVNTVRASGREAITDIGLNLLIKQGVKAAKLSVKLSAVAGGTVLVFFEVAKESWSTSKTGLYIGGLINISATLETLSEYYSSQNSDQINLVDLIVSGNIPTGKCIMP